MRLNGHRRRSAVNFLVRPGRAGRKRAAAPEDHLPDRTPEPAEGERQRYPLPNEYGPARPPLGNDDDLFDDDIPTVTLHERDAVTLPQTVGSAATAPVAPTVATVAVTANGQGGGAHAEGPTTERPLSRRELREQRERAQATEKTSTKTTRPPRSKRAKWIRRGHRDRGRAPAHPGRGVVRRLPATARQRHALGAHGRVDPRPRRQRHRQHRRTLVVHEQPAADRRQAERDQGAGHRHRHHDQGRHRAPDLPADPAPPAADARVPTPAPEVEPNEGVWQPTGRLVSGQPAVYTTYVRPDAAHTSYYTGLMWLDTKLLRANYVVGTEQPGGGPNPWGSQIPESQRDIAIAAFNSGFKMDSANGGAYLDGQEIAPLRERRGVARDQPGRLGERRRVGPRLHHVARHQGGAPEPRADRRQRAAEPRAAGERHQRVGRHARQQRVRVAFRRRGHRRRRARVRRGSGDVDRLAWRAPCRRRARCAPWRWTSTPTG